MNSQAQNNGNELLTQFFEKKQTGKKINLRGINFPLYFLSFPELGYSKDFNDLLKTILYYHIYFNISPQYQNQDYLKLTSEIINMGFVKHKNNGFFNDIEIKNIGNIEKIETLATVKACLLIYSKVRLIRNIEIIAKEAKQQLETEIHLRGSAPFVSIETGNFLRYLNEPNIKNEELFRIYCGIKSKLGIPDKNSVKSSIKFISKEVIYSLARGSKSKTDLEKIKSRSIGIPFNLSVKKLRNRLQTIIKITDIKSYSIRKKTFYSSNRTENEIKSWVEEKYLKTFQDKEAPQKPENLAKDELPF